MASIAFPIQDLPRSLDSFVSKGPTSRNVIAAYSMIASINSTLQLLKAPGAGSYTLSEEWTEGTRVAYEAAVDDAVTKASALLLSLKALAKI